MLFKARPKTLKHGYLGLALLISQFSIGSLSFHETKENQQSITAQCGTICWHLWCLREGPRSGESTYVLRYFRGLALLSRKGGSLFIGEMFGCKFFWVHKTQRILGLLLGRVFCLFSLHEIFPMYLVKFWWSFNVFFNQGASGEIFLSAGTGLCSDFCPHHL